MSFSEELERERAQAIGLVRHASAGWAEAMRAHKMAPPDEGFAARLGRLAEAAATEQVAWERAHAAGLMWRPVPGAERAEPPYELRPGTGRRGPEELWTQFDAAVGRLNQAIAGSNSATVADAFGAMAQAAAELSHAVALQDQVVREAQERSRRRGAA
ncbi:MAG TPA: hypothetical protein VFP55_04955 [Solirubrobacteraceae bacterium]|nr:hypothetical protein [Solirubrobacteraceae bacterium]